MKEVTYEEALRFRHPVFVDVRAPVEFAMDHIPGSINLPVFDDRERSEIGTMYRMAGKEEAIIKGSGIVGKKLGDITTRIGGLGGKDVVITCFRGGMRSTSLVSLLSAIGFPVYKLKDGYRGYRRYVRRRMESLTVRPPVYVLHGLTGTGKTGILREMANAIDLEEMAGHRSSLFGGIGLSQKSQKMFESLLLARIEELGHAPYIVMEGESRKIGDIHLPAPLLRLINESSALLVTAPLERRIGIILEDYTRKDGAGAPDIEEITAILSSLEGRLGKKNIAHLRDLFRIGDLAGFIRILLEKYYDPLYGYSLERMRFIGEVENRDMAEAAREVEKIISVNLRRP